MFFQKQIFDPKFQISDKNNTNSAYLWLVRLHKHCLFNYWAVVDHKGFILIICLRLCLMVWNDHGFKLLQPYCIYCVTIN